MLVIVTYDVSTADSSGQKRLRKVAKLCEKNGIRVQSSVFEVSVDAARFEELKAQISEVIDLEQDSVRFYRLGNHYKNRIFSIGKSNVIKTDEPLIL